MLDARRLLDALWERYAAEVPYARTFVRLAGGAFENDHIALRSLARPGSGIAMFAEVFERLGWKRAGSYDFPDVSLRAIHLSQPGLPRVFVSELVAESLPKRERELVLSLEPDPKPSSDLVSWFAAPVTRPRAEDLEAVEKVSQYGAWLLAFGRKVNHFTASVDDVEAWQAKLLAAGVPMKGEIEGVRGGPLRQTATGAASLPITLADGTSRPWPYAYFEIAERAPGFDGFLTPQARNLFEMTRRP